MQNPCVPHAGRSPGCRLRGLVRLVLSAALLALVLTVCGTSALALTDDEIYALWGEAAKQFEATHTVQGPDSDDSRWATCVGTRIVNSWPDRRWVTHSFLVVQDTALGAWSFPVSPVRHRVYVTTGLLAFIRQRAGEECDDELAGVLAHEIAHLMRDHHLGRQRRAEFLRMKAPKDIAQWPARVLGEWQQEDELEADRYGAFYALHAGYRFDGMVHFLASYLRLSGNRQRLDAVAVGEGRVHPTLTARIAALRQEQSKVTEAGELFQWGLDLLRVGAWEAARGCFVGVRNTFMLSPTVVHDLGFAELRQYEASLPAGPPLAQCVATDYASQPAPKGPEAAPERGLLAEAKADFMKACELDKEGGFVAPRLGLACAYLYEGDDGKAQIQLQEVKVGAHQPAYLNLAGVLAERSGDSDAALRAYCRALGLPANASAQEAAAQAQEVSDPYLPALYNLAHLLESQGHRAEAAQLYRFFLSFEGSLSGLGIRARDGLLRCGGTLPQEQMEAVSSYRGMDLRSSGALVMKAALGEPESQHTFQVGQGGITLCEYPAQGITVVLAAGLAEESVVTCVALSEPNRDAMMGVYLGDTAASLRKRLGNPRAVIAESGEGSWWNYGRYGLAFQVEGGKVTRCLVGRRK
jgi:Zn-dependent protease with chaperone function